MASGWRNTPCRHRTKSFPGPWDSYMHSPSSRTVSPITIYDASTGTLCSYPSNLHLSHNGHMLVYDFGREVGGIVSLKYAAQGEGKLGLAFSESRDYTGPDSDGSNGSYHPGGDGALWTLIGETTDGTYCMPDAKMRGGFRYLSLLIKTDTVIDVEMISVELEISFQPNWVDLQAYGGYFHCNDELINRIWYAGAYTLQTNTIPSNSGRVFPLLNYGWDNSAYLGTPGPSIFVDGSKRDRATWSGDLLMALPSAFVSTGDFESAKRALQLVYDLQKPSGELPMAGPPLNFYGSDTYHMSSLIGTYDYVLYSGDIVFLTFNWSKITSAISFIASKIDHTGLLHVTGAADWGRYAQGGHNTEANALMFGTLKTGSSMAKWMGFPDLAASWIELAERLKAAANSTAYIWDPQVGAFKDSSHDGSIHPEDGNSLAIYYGMASTPHIQPISTQLTTNWCPIGAICPELPGTICPFIESFEVKAHLSARQATRALTLMRISWGWYLNHPSGTGSTCPEGYLADGTWGYRASSGYGGDYSYMSHAHGWSTGPTHALSTFVLGLQLLAPGGSEWVFAPQFGDLTSVEGGFTTGLGKFSAKWMVTDGGYSLEYDVPSETQGALVLPARAGRNSSKVMIDGQLFASTLFETLFDCYAGTIKIERQEGGKHEISVAY